MPDETPSQTRLFADAGLQRDQLIRTLLGYRWDLMTLEEFNSRLQKNYLQANDYILQVFDCAQYIGVQLSDG